VKRSLVSGSAYNLVGTPSGTNFTDVNLTNGTPYYYVVSAVNAAGEGGDSAEVTATPFATPITLVPGSYSNGQFNLQFQGVNGRDYIILMSTNLVDWTPLVTNQPSGGVFIFTDVNASDAMRFYRAQQ
jgi:hypothetical protein